MLDKAKTFVKESKFTQFVLVFGAGLAIGAIFYPSKTIIKEVKVEDTTRIDKLTEEKKQLESKHQEELTAQKKETSNIEATFKSKLEKLTVENRDLKSKQKTAYFKIVRPDGTVEIKKFSESEVNESTKVVTEIKQEFETKIKAIEEKWVDIHQKRVAEIKETYDSKVKEQQEHIHKLEEYQKTEINKRSTGIELGYLTNNRAYGHVSRDLFGPVFLGVHAQGALDGTGFAAGAGLGLRW